VLQASEGYTYTYDGCSSFQKHDGNFTAFRKFAAKKANELLYKRTDATAYETLAEYIEPTAWNRLLERIIGCPCCRGKVAKYFARAFRKNGLDVVMFATKRHRKSFTGAG